MPRVFDLVVVGGGIVGAYVASASVSRGLSVALIDVGPQSISSQLKAKPTILFGRREHLGCISARNHVLGGNGYYWGGGLMRPPGHSLTECLGLPTTFSDGDTIDLGPNFHSVEQGMGLRHPPSRSPSMFTEVDGGCLLTSEICVLPGKSRNLSSAWLRSLRSHAACAIYAPAEVLSFESDQKSADSRNLRAVWVIHKGCRTRILGRRYLLSAGAVDSNLIVQKFADQLTYRGANANFGRGMHDHWSVPIAEVRLGAGGAIREAIAPQFRDGMIFGRHFEFETSPSRHGRGFLHFTFAFDDAPPYREIKRLMLLRQQGAPLSRWIHGLVPLVGQLPAMTRIGMERLVRKRLYLGSEIRITATLDFESFPHANNCLRMGDDHATFDWEISREDEITFLELLRRSKYVLTNMGRQSQLDTSPLFDFENDDAALSHFHANAADAFHLGGGLTAGADAKASAVNMQLLLHGTENLHVLSTATYARAGLVNPTHTLLALADRFVSQL